MSNKAINIIAALLFYAAGVATAWTIVRFAGPTTKADPAYIGVYYTDTWHGKEGARIEINADGSCELPGSWYNITNSECFYEVDGKKVYFYGLKTTYVTIGKDGLMYGNYYFKRME